MSDRRTAKTAAERQRRYRARRHVGLFVAPVEVSETHLDSLIAGGWLREEDATDVLACAAAVVQVLNALGGRPVTRDIGSLQAVLRMTHDHDK